MATNQKRIRLCDAIRNCSVAFRDGFSSLGGYVREWRPAPGVTVARVARIGRIGRVARIGGDHRRAGVQ